MKYHINKSEVEDATLQQQARGLEERALMMEYEADRFEAVGTVNPAYAAQMDQQRENAKAARKEADAFIKAAKAKKVINDDDLASLRRDALTRIIQSVEQQHVAADTIRSVRRDSGLPVPDRDNAIEELELSWEVANAKLEALPAPKAEGEHPNRAGRRAAVRGAASKTGKSAAKAKSTPTAE